AREFSVEITPIRVGVSNTTERDNRSEVHWNWKNSDAFQADPTVFHSPCPDLYHELVHSYDNALDQIDNRQCFFGGGTDGLIKKGPEIGEVHAVRAENHYRAALGLPMRHTYGGFPLPPGRDATIDAVHEACQPQSGPPRPKHPTTSGS